MAAGPVALVVRDRDLVANTFARYGRNRPPILNAGSWRREVEACVGVGVGGGVAAASGAVCGPGVLARLVEPA